MQKGRKGWVGESHSWGFFFISQLYLGISTFETETGVWRRKRNSIWPETSVKVSSRAALSLITSRGRRTEIKSLS